MSRCIQGCSGILRVCSRYAPGELRYKCSSYSAYLTLRVENTTPSWLQRNVKCAKFIKVKVKIEVKWPSGKLTVRCLLDPTLSPANVQWWVYKENFRMRASPFSAQFVFLFMQFTRKFGRIIGWWEILDPLLADTANLNFTKNIKFREREQGVMKTPSPFASWKNCHWLG